MKLQSDAEFAAFVGIDWADTKHDICLQVATSEEREFAVVPHLADAIEAWVGSLRHRFEGQPVAVGLELAKGPLVYALQKYDFLVLFPLHPSTHARPLCSLSFMNTTCVPNRASMSGCTPSGAPPH